MVSKSVGVLVKDTGLSQLNFNMIRSLNRFIYQHRDNYCCMFFENIGQIMANTHFPIMNIAEAYEWKGTLVATSLSSAHKLISFPSCKDKYFYVSDLEWIRLRQHDYKLLGSIYNSGLKVIARSEPHAALLSEVWGCKIEKVSENLDFLLDS